MKFSTAVLAFVLTLSSGNGNQSEVSGFCQVSKNFKISFSGKRQNQPNQSALCLTPPTMIISPMIRKWREEQAKKNMPMASEEELGREAPGLKVGVNAWKWPPVWPYDDDFFGKVGDETVDPAVANNMAAMMNGMSGGTSPALPTTATPGKKLDSVAYWSEEKADVLTAIDEGAANSIRNHYSYYLRDGMSVLELGAAEESYLPENLKLSEHVGVGLTPNLMAKNPNLTQSLVVDLNKVIEGTGVDSEELYNLGSERFDAILMANTIDFLTEPREVFRTAWRLLKPGGIMICPFVNRDAYVDKFEQAQTRMWRKFNDDQHIYVCGSFFYFSAAQGWEGLTGFDITPPEAKDEGPLGFLNPKKPMKAFVAQARKSALPEEIDEEDPEDSFVKLMSLTPVMESRDKTLLAPRLARVYQAAKSGDERRRLQENIETLPKVYESLVKMDQFQFPFGLQSQLAAEVVSNPSFVGNDEQLEALSMGLGLRSPSKEFWGPVGKLTASMKPEDKVSLLSYIVPRFGSGDKSQEQALDAFVTALEPTFAVVQSKCPDMSRSDVELVGTELLAAEILIPGRSTREEFAKWLGSLTAGDLEEILQKRKSYNEEAKSQLEAMRQQREEEEKKREEEMKEYQRQIEKAREERTLVLNEKTGKMEYVEKK